MPHLSSPAFWHKSSSLLANILAPLGWLYGQGVVLRHRFTTPQKLSVPVICIGNLVLGGAGKTPTALTIAKLLQAKGHTPHFLSRGYGRKRRDLLCVDLAKHTFRDVGDEPLLLARLAPTWVYRDRFIAGQYAIAAGATILILDDGYQNPTLHKDCHLLIQDSQQGHGNGHIFPAGPLREAPRAAIARADALITINTATTGTIHAILVPQAPSFSAPVTAFAGLGYPEKFRQTLQQLNIPVHHFQAFPDHYPYTDNDLTKLQHFGAPLVTTEKDYLRLPPYWQTQVQTVKIELVFPDSQKINDLLERFC